MGEKLNFQNSKETREREEEIEKKKERLNEILSICDKIMYKRFDCIGHAGLPGTKDYLLIGKVLGTGNENNSPFTIAQLEMALALGDRQSVDDFLSFQLEERNRTYQQFSVELRKMIDSKPLSNLKILDLGCGFPGFARIARASGADVYTVDIFGIEGFEYKDKDRVDPRIIEEEERKHIQLDLEDPRSIEILKKRTNGNFNLVTHSHLYTPGTGRHFTGDVERIAIPLLKENGILFSAVERLGSIKLSENEYIQKRGFPETEFALVRVKDSGIY